MVWTLREDVVMVNHFYDGGEGATRCRQYRDPMAWDVSANGWVSCNECMDRLTPEEREGEWYGRTD